MTHLCSAEVTQSRNKTLSDNRSICYGQGHQKYHPALEVRLGFCFLVSSHAEGVVAGCALYVVSGRAQPLEFLSRVLVVLVTYFRFEDFFYDRHEVGQRAHGGQRRSIRGPDHAAYGGEHKSVLDLVQGYAALIELNSQQAIWPAQIAAGSWGVAVGLQNLAYIVFAAG